MKAKPTRDSLRKTAIIIGIISTILIIISSISLYYFDAVIDKQIAKQIPIKHGTESFEKWQKIAVPLTIKFFLFNVTNAYEVINFGDKPILQQCGPYTFIETREKQQIRFENNGERVIFKEFKYYYFDQSRTNGSLDDMVIVPNIPEIAMASQIISKAEAIPQLAEFLYGILNAAFHISDTSIFGKRKVREMLFEGYKVKAIEEMEKIIKGIPNSPIPFESPLRDNLFGLFIWKNGTDDPESLDWRIDTGLADASTFGQVHSYDDKRENTCWRNSYYCNTMLGGDGSQFPPGLDLPAGYENRLLEAKRRKNKEFDSLLQFEHTLDDISGKRRLYVYNPDIYRSVYLTYERDTEVRGIKAYRYTIPDIFYTSPADAPENACFCTKAPEYDLNEFNKKFLAEHVNSNNNHPKNFVELKNLYKNSFPPQCRLNGILDISYCKKAPVIISAPHFYKADALLVHSVEGIKPDAKKHKTYVDIEPRTGIVINAARRAQINIELVPHNNVAPFRTLQQVISNINNNYNNYNSQNSFNNYNGLILPILWLEETAQVDEKNANLLKSKLINKIKLFNGILLFLLNLSVICLTVCLVYLIFVKFILKRKDYDKSYEDDTLPKKKPIT